MSVQTTHDDEARNRYGLPAPIRTIVGLVVTDVRHFMALVHCRQPPALDYLPPESRWFEIYVEAMQSPTPKRTLEGLRSAYSLASHPLDKLLVFFPWVHSCAEGEEGEFEKLEVLGIELFRQVQQHVEEVTDPESFCMALSLGVTLSLGRGEVDLTWALADLMAGHVVRFRGMALPLPWGTFYFSTVALLLPEIMQDQPRWQHIATAGRRFAFDPQFEPFLADYHDMLKTLDSRAP